MNYTCHICNKKFAAKGSRNNHKHREHKLVHRYTGKSNAGIRR